MASTAPPTAALGAAELAKWVDASCLRADGLLFTGTARTDLDEIASWQRLADLAFAGQCRAIVAGAAFWRRPHGAERRQRSAGTGKPSGVGPI